MIYHKHPDIFAKQMLGGNIDVLAEFWSEMRTHPAMNNHPLQTKPGFNKKAIPLGLHGDGVPVSGIGRKWAQSTLAISWQTMLSS
eukprot:4600357-Alexandrium_andersonii.AAC.1